MADARAITTHLLERRGEFLAFLERRLGDRAAAEDVLQESLLRALERAGEVHTAASARAWFYRVLRNALLDRRRTDERRSRLDAAHLPEEEGPPEPAREACRCVLDVAAALRPGWAEALDRVEVGEMRVSAFASAAGITPGNASVRLHRARAALRAGVIETCGSCAATGCGSCSCEVPGRGTTERGRSRAI